MRKCRLIAVRSCLQSADPLTSDATPGTNMATASAWKNFRLAFSRSVGTCLSAASNRSVATFGTAPFGMFGIGNDPNVIVSVLALPVAPELPVLEVADSVVGPPESPAVGESVVLLVRYLRDLAI